MKRSIPIMIILLTACTVNLTAQQVISTAGTHVKTGIAQISWTIGETVTETLVAADYCLNQGFQQNILIITSIRQETAPGITLTVYPNPASEVLKLESASTHQGNISYQFFDIKGKLLFAKDNVILPENINIAGYMPGIYLLNVFTDKNIILNTHKIIKK